MQKRDAHTIIGVMDLIDWELDSFDHGCLALTEVVARCAKTTCGEWVLEAAQIVETMEKDENGDGIIVFSFPFRNRVGRLVFEEGLDPLSELADVLNRFVEEYKLKGRFVELEEEVTGVLGVDFRSWHYILY